MPQVIAGATYVVMFKAYLASDHVTEATGKTIAMTISKNGGAFGNPNAGATNATEVSSGWYKFSLDATDTATVGPVAWRGAVATIDDAGGIVDVIAQYATPTNITAGTVTTVSGNVNGSVGSVTGAVGSVTGAVGSVTGNVGGNVVGSVASVTGNVGGTVATVTNLTNAPTNGDLTATMKTSVTTAVPTAVQNGAATVATAVDGATTLAQSLALSNSALGGKLSGAGTGTETARDLADSKDRLVYTVDSSGNRTAVSRTLT